MVAGNVTVACGGAVDEPNRDDGSCSHEQRLAMVVTMGFAMMEAGMGHKNSFGGV